MPIGFGQEVAFTAGGVDIFGGDGSDKPRLATFLLKEGVLIAE